LIFSLENTGVGKTCMMLKFASGIFTTEFVATIGIDFKARTVMIDDKNIKIQVKTIRVISFSL
jgi:GTPase SAR1 family protein